MAKWIYEKWQPKWPEATGAEGAINRSEVVDVFDFSGASTQVPEESIETGAVFYSSRSQIYGVKTAGSSRSYRAFDPPDVYPTPLKDTLIENLTAEDGTYPDDGVHSDNFYYVKIKKAFPTLTIGGQVISGAKFKDADGVVKTVSNVLFKDASGVVRALK